MGKWKLGKVKEFPPKSHIAWIGIHASLTPKPTSFSIYVLLFPSLALRRSEKHQDLQALSWALDFRRVLNKVIEVARLVQRTPGYPSPRLSDC